MSSSADYRVVLRWMIAAEDVCEREGIGPANVEEALGALRRLNKLAKKGEKDG